MFKTKRLVFLLVLAIMLLAMPAGVLANKQVFKAKMSPENGFDTFGFGVVATAPDGLMFNVAVFKFAEPGDIVITDDEGTFAISLCADNPAANCEVDSNGVIKAIGKVRSKPDSGVTGPEIYELLYSGKLNLEVLIDGNLAASGGLN